MRSDAWGCKRCAAEHDPPRTSHCELRTSQIECPKGPTPQTFCLAVDSRDGRLPQHTHRGQRLPGVLSFPADHDPGLSRMPAPRPNSQCKVKVSRGYSATSCRASRLAAHCPACTPWRPRTTSLARCKGIRRTSTCGKTEKKTPFKPHIMRNECTGTRNVRILYGIACEKYLLQMRNKTSQKCVASSVMPLLIPPLQSGLNRTLN